MSNGTERTTRPIAVAELHLDPKNPRLPEGLAGKSEPAILKYFFEHEVLDELAQSFVDNGYFVAEPLIVMPVPAGEKTTRGKERGYYVLEGNRRLAALKVLHQAPEAEGLSFGDIQPPPGEFTINEVPCFVVDDVAKVAAFIGFRHIGGLKVWEPEAKARYILLHVDEAKENGAANPFLEIARRVGSNTQGIRGSYVAIAILRQARDAFGIRTQPLLTERRFGVWQRALNSPQFREYIGFGDPTTYDDVRASLDALREGELQEVILDFTPPSPDEKPIIRDSRQVTDYGKVLVSKSARAVLRKSKDLELARQLVLTEDLPTRVRKLGERTEVLTKECARVEMSDVLRDAIDEFFASAKQLNGLARN